MYLEAQRRKRRKLVASWPRRKRIQVDVAWYKTAEGHAAHPADSLAGWACVRRSALMLSLRKFAGYLLEPFDELVKQGSERLLSLPVVQTAVFVGLDIASMPSTDEVHAEHGLLIQRVHEGVDVLLLVLGELHEVQRDRLDQALDAHVAVRLDQLKEAGLVLGPQLHHVPLALEKRAEEDVVLELGGDVED